MEEYRVVECEGVRVRLPVVDGVVDGVAFENCSNVLCERQRERELIREQVQLDENGHLEANEAITRRGCRALVKSWFNTIATEQELLSYGTGRLDAGEVARMRREHNIVGRPSQHLADVVIGSDGRPEIRIEAICSDTKPRELIGHVVGDMPDGFVGVTCFVEQTADSRPTFRSSRPRVRCPLPMGDDTLGGARKWRSIRIVRVGTSSFAEYGPYVCETDGFGALRYVYDIPMMMLTRRELRWLMRKWPDMDPHEKDWWCGYDIMLRRAVSQGWKSAKYLFGSENYIRYGYRHRLVLQRRFSRAVLEMAVEQVRYGRVSGCGSDSETDSEGVAVVPEPEEDVWYDSQEELEGEDQMSWFPSVQLQPAGELRHRVTIDLNGGLQEEISKLGSILKTEGLDWVRFSASLGLLIAGLMSCWTKSQMMIHIGQFLVGVSVPTRLRGMIKDLIMKYLEMNDEGIDVAEGAVGRDEGVLDSSETNIVALIGGVMLLALTAVTAGVLPGDKQFSEYINRFSRMGLCMRTIESAMDYGGRFAKLMKTTVGETVFGVPDAGCTAFGKIREWCDEVSELMSTQFEADCRYNRELQAKIDRLLKEGSDHMKWLESSKIERTRVERFYRMWSILMQCRSLAAGAGVKNMKARPAPVVVHFVGDSGCGKSSMLYPLIADLLVELGHTESTAMQDMVYWYRPGTENFWSGFHTGVKIVVVDDIFTLKDVPGLPSREALDTIAMANTAAMQIPMAHLSEKGNTFFRAPVVIWTSNSRDYKFDSLTNTEAVWNRVTLQYLVEPDECFSEEVVIKGKRVTRLNRKKVAEAEREAVDFVRFTQVDPLEQSVVRIGEGRMSYRAMAAQLIDKVNEHIERYETMQGKFDEYMKRAVERKKQGERVDGVIRDEIESEMVVGADQILDAEDASAWVRSNGWLRSNMVVNPVRLVMAHPEEAVLIPLDDDVEGQFHLPWTAGQGVQFLAGPWDCGWQKIVRDNLRYVMDVGVRMMLGQNVSAALDRLWAHIRPLQSRVASTADDVSIGDMVQWVAEHKIKCQSLTREMIEEAKSARLEMPDKWKMWVPIAAAVGTAFIGIGAVLWYMLRDRDRQRVYVVTDEGYGRGDKGVTLVHLEADVGCDRCMRKRQRVLDAANLIVDEGSFTERLSKITEIVRGTICGTKCAHIGQDESMSDVNGNEIAKKIVGNVYRLEQLVDGVWINRLQIVFVRGRIAVANRHLKKALGQPNSIWRIRSAKNPVGYQFAEKEMNYHYCGHKNDEVRDLMVIEFPVQVMQHVDLTKYIVTEEDIARLSSPSKAVLIGHDVSRGEPTMYMRTTSDVRSVDGPYGVKEGDSYVIRMRKYYQHGCETTVGDCGAPLVALETGLIRKWIGIHSGGVTSGVYTGVAQPLTVETIERYISDMKMRHDSSGVALVSPVVEDDTVLVGSDQLRVLGHLEEGHYELGRMGKYVGANRRTNIFPSPVADELWQTRTIPAKLGPFESGGEVIDPMKIARMKVLTGVNPVFDQEVLDDCVADVKQMMVDNVLEEDRNVKSWETAIVGVVGDDMYPPLNRKTSPGYGWDKTGGGKAKYFGRGDVYVLDHPEVVKVRDEYERKLERGERLGVVFEDALKDERRPIEKVLSGKTRLFSVGCQVFTVLFRRFFMGFVASVMRNRVRNEIAIGINPYSLEWSLLAYRLREVGDNVLAGDFTNYDGTLSAEVLWRVLEVVEHFYEGDEREKRIRMVLWSEIVNSLHVVGDRCYLWHHSNPSGCPITTVLNSIYHVIVARYVFLKVGERAGKRWTLREYHKSVRFVCYGDDDVWSIADELADVVTMENVTREFGEIGMRYTDETKKDGTGFRSLEEVRFLKRAFRYEVEEARYKAPLEISVVQEMASWVRGKRDVWKLTAEVLEQAMEELSLHEERVFDECRSVFECARRRVSVREECKFLTYRAYALVMQERVL